MVKKDFFEKREKELIEDLQDLEWYIKSFWEILPIPVCLTNPLFVILETGSAFDRLFGYKKDELIGSFLDIIFQKKPEFKDFSEKLLKERKILNFEVSLRAEGKEEITALVSAIVREDEKGETVGFLFSFVDVSLIKETESELREKIEELETMNRLMVGREVKMAELKKELEGARNALMKLKKGSGESLGTEQVKQIFH